MYTTHRRIVWIRLLKLYLRRFSKRLRIARDFTKSIEILSREDYMKRAFDLHKLHLINVSPTLKKTFFDDLHIILRWKEFINNFETASWSCKIFNSCKKFFSKVDWKLLIQTLLKVSLRSERTLYEIYFSRA